MVVVVVTEMVVVVADGSVVVADGSVVVVAIVIEVVDVENPSSTHRPSLQILSPQFSFAGKSCPAL